MSRVRSMTQLVLLLGLVTLVLQVCAHGGGGRGGHGGHGGPPFGVAMMLECANDSCVPADLKGQIKSSWNQTTQSAFDTCLQQSGGPECTPANFKAVFMCLMENPERFGIMKDMSEKIKTLNDKITLGMLSCLREQRGGRGRGGPFGGEGGRGGPFGGEGRRGGPFGGEGGRGGPFGGEGGRGGGGGRGPFGPPPPPPPNDVTDQPGGQ